jgi:hypothetical protein
MGLKTSTARGHRRLLLVILGASVFTVSGLNLAGADGSCKLSSPASSAYSVNVCITTPLAGSTLTGSTPVTATVTITGKATISKVVFYLGTEYVLTDQEAPYTFVLPTANWTDGARTIAAEATMSDAFTTQRTIVPVTFLNGVVSPPGPSSGTFSPRSTTPPEGQPYVVAAVGDGAAGRSRSTQVSNLITSWNPNSFLYLGDVYEKGTSSEFLNWYGGVAGDYGRFKSITNPTVGNHEYSVTGARPYFDYWDNVPHYFSYNLGGWHLVSIDSNTTYNQLKPGTGQYNWLQQDLATASTPCVLVYYHHPRFSIVARGDILSVDPIWKLMSTYGVDLVLNGHDHNYQRWVPMDGNGVPSPDGPTELIVGTGGKSVHVNTRTDSRVVTEIDTSPDAYGALRLNLGTSGLGYVYTNINGLTLDSGSIDCEETPDDMAPEAPTGLSAQAASGDTVNLSWTAATDNVGVTGYDVYRNGTQVGAVGTQTNYVDKTVQPGGTYEYSVTARDAAGNSSESSNLASVTTPTHLFADGFETGSLANWTSNFGVVVKPGEGFGGTYGARATSSGPAVYVRKDLSPGQTNLYFNFRFKVLAKSSHAVYLMRYRTSTNYVIGGVFINKYDKLSWRNNPGNLTTISSMTVTKGVWHDAQVHVAIAGVSSAGEVWLDGTKVISRSETLGTTPATRLHLGESQAETGRSFDIVFDDVTLDL